MLLLTSIHQKQPPAKTASAVSAAKTEDGALSAVAIAAPPTSFVNSSRLPKCSADIRTACTRCPAAAGINAKARLKARATHSNRSFIVVKNYLKVTHHIKWEACVQCAIQESSLSSSWCVETSELSDSAAAHPGSQPDLIRYTSQF
eukprot:7491-Heterococcus_DN1.PRE.3